MMTMTFGFSAERTGIPARKIRIEKADVQDGLIFEKVFILRLKDLCRQKQHNRALGPVKKTSVGLKLAPRLIVWKQFRHIHSSIS